MSEKQYTDPIYDLDGKISVSKAIPFGLQHILAMFVANIAPILIVAGVVKMPVEQSGALVQSAMLVAGIGTLIQLYPVWRVGSGLPITSFSQNVGLIAMTKVVNRFAIMTGAVIMILAGLFPALGVLLASLPEAVLGGCTLMMFGSIVVSGVQMIANCGYNSRNVTIASLALSIGIGFTQTPAIFKIFPDLIKNVFAENCVAVVFIVAMVLNILLPKEEEE